MPLLRDVPLLGGPSDLVLPDGSALIGTDGAPVRTGSNQFIFWASFIPHGQPVVPSTTGRFAVVIDTGFGDTVLIREEQLDHLVGIPYRLLAKARDPQGKPLQVRVGGGHILTKYRVDLLLYPNEPGYRDRPDPTASPVLLRFSTGMLVWPKRLASGDRVRLPLLGTLGIHETGVAIALDGVRGFGQMSI